MRSFFCIVLLFWGVPNLLAQSDKPAFVESGAGSVEMAISGSGNPVVVFESGFSDTYEYWSAVVSAISTKTKTVRYNRAGFGQSPLNGQPRTAEQIATELHAALSNAKLAPPYLLVGHSAGGMYVRVFAHLFPADGAGIVLVDPAPESFYGMLSQQDPALWKAVEDELKNLPGAKAQLDVNATTVDQVRAAWPLPKVPTTVISATKVQPPVFTEARRKEMTSLQTALVRQIPGAQQVEASGCGHNIPVECPSVVSQAVLTMLTKISKK